MDAETQASNAIKAIIRKSLNSHALITPNVSCNDKSCDDISDIELNDVPAQLEQTMKQSRTSNETKSLFNINIDEFFDCNTVGDELEEYQNKLKEDQLEWIDFVVQATRAFSGGCKPASEMDFQPSETHQAILKQLPNLQKFVRGSVEFINKTELFNDEHWQIMELQETLLQRCKTAVSQRKRKALAKNLARE